MKLYVKPKRRYRLKERNTKKVGKGKQRKEAVLSAEQTKNISCARLDADGARWSIGRRDPQAQTTPSATKTTGSCDLT